MSAWALAGIEWDGVQFESGHVVAMQLPHRALPSLPPSIGQARPVAAPCRCSPLCVQLGQLQLLNLAHNALERPPASS